MCSIGNTFSINKNLCSDSEGIFKNCSKEGVFHEVARYFRKSYDCCRCCENCIYCFDLILPLDRWCSTKLTFMIEMFYGKFI